MRNVCLCSFLPILVLATSACSAGDDSTGSGSGTPRGTGGTDAVIDPGSGTGNTTGVNQDGGTGGPVCGAALGVTYRDFKGFGEAGGHPDFEIAARNVIGPDGQVYKGWNDVGCGLVEPALGANSKPVFYAGAPEIKEGGPTDMNKGIGRLKRVVEGPGCWTPQNPTPSGICRIGTCEPWDFNPPTYEIASTATFNQWYNTVEGVNMELEGVLELTETSSGSGTFVYDSNAFFPLDNAGFGNTPGQAHNYHFTTEAHVRFAYVAGQKFTFRGDDDLWIFVNGKLALDVGGLHQALEGTIDFDAQAAHLGITPGNSYQMDIFHAERHTTDSNFRIETNISCFEDVIVR